MNFLGGCKQSCEVIEGCKTVFAEENLGNGFFCTLVFRPIHDLILTSTNSDLKSFIFAKGKSSWITRRRATLGFFECSKS